MSLSAEALLKFLGLWMGVSVTLSLVVGRMIGASATPKRYAESLHRTSDRLAQIEVLEDRLRSALTEWADDDLLVAKMQELEREAEALRDVVRRVPARARSAVS
jgi:hypothetical protein